MKNIIYASSPPPRLWVIGGGPSSLKFPPGMGLGGSVKFLIYFLEWGGPGNLETPLATPLRPPPPGVPTSLYNPRL